MAKNGGFAALVYRRSGDGMARGIEAATRRVGEWVGWRIGAVGRQARGAVAV